MRLGDVVGHLVEGASDEIDELHLHYGPQAEVAHARGRADDGRLADRRIDHALPAEAFEQPCRDLERAAVDADILAQQDDRRVAVHLFEQGLANRFEIGDQRQEFISALFPVLDLVPVPVIHPAA